jgi:3-oxoacyl-[acyl-carrier protein] reductase
MGGLDGLVNNAAMLDESNAADVTEARFERVLSVNLTSILRVSQAALPHLGGGVIVNTLSTQAMFGQANSVAYATAKGGGLNLTRAMAIDFAPQGIRVNAVAPGFIDTRMAVMADGTHEHPTDWFKGIYVGRRKIPLARAGTPADCAGAYLFLLSDMASYITGQCLAVDGGLTATY